VEIVEQFGFLNYPKELNFGHGQIAPRADFEASLKFVEKYGNRDGYIYPPQVRTYCGDFSEASVSELVPNTERPAQVFDLPMSHDLIIRDPIDSKDVRHADAGLIVHLLAFFFGARLQFIDWSFDGRVPTKPTNSLIYKEDVPEHFVTVTYAKWRAWPTALQRRFINIIYMHGRAHSCLWEWERFIYQYMVFDAIYKFHTELGGQSVNGHGRRISGLCQAYGVPENKDLIDKISKLRNELFHEALWDGNTPGLRSGEAFLMEKWLGNLNSRLIVALTGYRNDFTRRGWWFFGWQPFDRLVKSQDL